MALEISEMSTLMFNVEDAEEELLCRALYVDEDDIDVDESQPPATAEEYLKRVMKEAQQIKDVARGDFFWIISRLLNNWHLLQYCVLSNIVENSVHLNWQEICNLHYCYLTGNFNPYWLSQILINLALATVHKRPWRNTGTISK